MYPMGNILIIFIILIFFYFYNYFECRVFKIKKEKFHFGKSLKGILITDFHDNKINLERLKAEVERFNPDVVLLGGDIISRDTRDFTNVENFLKIFKGHRTVFVTGNHEEENKDLSTFLSLLNKYNVTNLGEIEYVEIEGVRIYGNYSPKNVLDDGYVNILLSHSISYFFRENLNYDLNLSGHTHGGQVRLPFVGQIIAHGYKFFPKYSMGRYEVGESLCYISGGLGNSVFPIRFLNRVSITEFEIY